MGRLEDIEQTMEELRACLDSGAVGGLVVIAVSPKAAYVKSVCEPAALSTTLGYLNLAQMSLAAGLGEEIEKRMR